jgi:hypothetical protein
MIGCSEFVDGELSTHRYGMRRRLAAEEYYIGMDLTVARGLV